MKLTGNQKLFDLDNKVLYNYQPIIKTLVLSILFQT